MKKITPSNVEKPENAPVDIQLEEIKSYDETAYLMKNSKNAERINQAVEQLESKKGKECGRNNSYNLITDKIGTIDT